MGLLPETIPKFNPSAATRKARKTQAGPVCRSIGQKEAQGESCRGLTGLFAFRSPSSSLPLPSVLLHLPNAVAWGQLGMMNNIRPISTKNVIVTSTVARLSLGNSRSRPPELSRHNLCRVLTMG